MIDNASFHEGEPFREINVLYLKHFVEGDSRKKQEFADLLVENLQKFGFFYLNTSGLNSNFFYHPKLFFERYSKLFNEMLLEQPFLNRYMNASNVFKDGYNLDWFPENTTIDQPIEAMLIKPRVWRKFRNKNLPPSIRCFLNTSEKIYRMIHNTSFVLFNALEKAYNFKSGTLKKLLIKRRDGAIRFVKYHRPNSLTESDAITTYVSEPHIDESFFTFNLGESKPGLVFIDNDKEILLPGTTRECLLITSGMFSSGLTRLTKRPIRAFRHTVKNDSERMVGLGFVAPEGGLHYLPVEKWPILESKTR